VDETAPLTCTDPDTMLRFLSDKASNRKLRLLGVACYRLIWPVEGSMTIGARKKSRTCGQGAGMLAEALGVSIRLANSPDTTQAELRNSGPPRIFPQKSHAPPVLAARRRPV
jgi:hypothetical protein